MNDSKSETLSDICAELFSLSVYLRESRELEQPDILHERITGILSAIDGKVRELSLSEADTEDIKYALVGFIDETVGWASRLEQEYFRANIAGEEFFRRLERIRESGVRKEVLQIYYLCLTLGFEGRYFRDPERLQGYIQELRESLELKSAESISPHGGIPQEVIRHRSVGIPKWTPWVVAAAGVVIIGIVLIVLKININGYTIGVINRIRGFFGA